MGLSIYACSSLLSNIKSFSEMVGLIYTVNNNVWVSSKFRKIEIVLTKFSDNKGIKHKCSYAIKWIKYILVYLYHGNISYLAM